MNKTFPLFKFNLLVNSCLSSSVKNLSNDDLNVLSSFTFIYASPLPPIVLTYSSIALYQELDFSILSTFIPRIVVSLNGANDVLLNISVNSVIINGFLKSGLSEPYINIASL